MPKFEAKKGDFAKIWQKLGGYYSPPPMALPPMALTPSDVMGGGLGTGWVVWVKGIFLFCSLSVVIISFVCCDALGRFVQTC